MRTRSSSLNLLVQNNEGDRHGVGSGGGVPVGRARENTYSFVWNIFIFSCRYSLWRKKYSFKSLNILLKYYIDSASIQFYKYDCTKIFMIILNVYDGIFKMQHCLLHVFDDYPVIIIFNSYPCYKILLKEFYIFWSFLWGSTYTYNYVCSKMGIRYIFQILLIIYRLTKYLRAFQNYVMMM